MQNSNLLINNIYLLTN